MTISSKTVVHTDDIKRQDQGVISAATVAAVGAAPTKAEFDAVVALVNDLRQIMLNWGVVSAS